MNSVLLQQERPLLQFLVAVINAAFVIIIVTIVVIFLGICQEMLYSFCISATSHNTQRGDLRPHNGDPIYHCRRNDAMISCGSRTDANILRSPSLPLAAWQWHSCFGTLKTLTTRVLTGPLNTIL